MIFGQNWAKYQAYSLTFWPKLAHFKHFSLQNQNLWNWFLVKIGQNTKPIALLFGQNWPILSTFHFAKSKSLKLIFGQNWQNSKPIALLFWPKLAQNQFQSTFHFAIQSALKLGQNWPKYQAYSLTFWPILAQNFSSKSKILKLIFGQNWAKYQAYSLTFWPKLAHFKHFSLQNQNLWNWFLVKIGQNTKPIALLFGQNWPILSTFHCKIKIFEIDFWSKLGKIPSL